MSRKIVGAISGLVLGAVLNVLYNLIAAAIEQRAINFFTGSLIVIMILLALIGLLIGFIIDHIVAQPTIPQQTAAPQTKDQLATQITTIVQGDPKNVSIQNGNAKEVHINMN